MPWRSSFPCHRMCCGPDTLLWFALSVFRIADMIGINGHVSFLTPKKKKKKKKKKGFFHQKKILEKKTWSPPSRGGRVLHTLGTRRAIARLNGRDANKPAMETLSAACQRTCRSRPSSTGQPCTQCRCRNDAQQRLPGLRAGSLPRLQNMVQYAILLSRALSAQHLPPHARACSIRFGSMSRSTVSALHITCH